MKKIKSLFAMLLVAGLCISGGALWGEAESLNNATAQEKPMRGVWVSTVYNLDYPTQPTTSPEALKAQVDQILDNVVKMGMNAVILQVRPSADALYPSSIFPWSKYVTGNQNTAPADGFDPLQYWVTKAHEKGVELHAWINPYRITKGQDAEYAALAANSPAKLHPQWVVKYTDGNYYFNPGIPEVRQLVVNGVQEILAKYAVDGIHLDDYFYPGTDFGDNSTFAQYGAGFSSIGDWRRDNVNQLVQSLRDVVKSSAQTQGRAIAFGISPAGIWANQKSLAEGSNTSGNQSYFSQYADTRRWVKEGWIDYICPQIYWYIGQTGADYRILAHWWADTVRGTNVKLYIGMADYRAGDPNASSPWHGITAIQNEIALNQTIPEIAGEMHFRYQLMIKNPALCNFYAQTYNTGAYFQ